MVEDLSRQNSLYDDDQDVEPSHSNSPKHIDFLQRMADTNRKQEFNPVIERDPSPMTCSIEDSIKGTFFAQVKSNIDLQGNIMVIVSDSMDNPIGRK